MAYFSPALMQALPVETLPMSKGHIRAKKGTPAKFYHWSGTHSEFFQFVRACRDDQSEGGEHFRRNIPREIEGQRSWSAVNEPAADFINSGVSKDAYTAFKAASAKLHANRLQPGLVRPAVAGGAWVVPLVLASNPMAARIRERTKLPPLSLNLGLTAMAMTNWKDITNSLAPVAHAIWEYIQAGGAVNLTVHHCWSFSQRQDGVEGVMFSIKPSLTSEAAFATACSVQTLRAMALLLGQSLSGQPGGNDGMPLAYYCAPGIHMLNGLKGEDADILKALNVNPA